MFRTKKTLDSIVSTLTTTLSDLDTFRNDKATEIAEAQKKIDELAAERDAAEAASVRAGKITENLKTLLAV